MASTSSTSRMLSMDELNKLALEQFVYQPVSREMIAYLADAAHNVITCDSTLMPTASEPQQAADSLPPTPPRSPADEDAKQDQPRSVQNADGGLPTVEEFITQLVVSSNVQVPTLMSTLVYLTRLKSKLQPMARGLRCTTHRIFLAALILAAKYLNDSSPKNKHWANYTHIATGGPQSFGFNRTEVNLMEKQLLFLLEWDLRIDEHDLYRELDAFLEPVRHKIAHTHAKRMRHREEKRRQQELYAAAAVRYPSPPGSRTQSRSRHASPEQIRMVRAGSITPPGLTYSSSASSYASSVCSSSRQQSRSTTPLDSEAEPFVYEKPLGDSLYDSPVQIPTPMDKERQPKVAMSTGSLLPYEMGSEQYQQMQDGVAKKRHRRGMWSRLLGSAVTVR
ncbi:PHO85 cyclin-1 [Lecanicillium sp. MT-2017a]|nr:PHO85 cyclin-1 [Lecanicillium sp. MT-2017a]